jgi:DUF4097 and DUF4098 domain-containing protein YvlB
MASWDFQANEPVEAEIRITDGSVAVESAASGGVSVEIEPGGGGPDLLSSISVEYQDGRLVITDQRRSGLLASRASALDVRVQLPRGSSGEISTAAADVRCDGEFGALKVTTASGDVTARQVAGVAEIQTASGDICIGRCGAARIKTVSGDAWVSRADGNVTCQSVSGDVNLGSVAVGRIGVKTTSGDITVAVVPGICLRYDLATLTGDVTGDLDEADAEATTTVTCHMTVTCQSVSGDIRLRRAAELPVS